MRYPPLIYVTLVLSDNAWAKILNAAALYWPTQKIDTMTSRQESIRRLLLSGIDQLRAVSTAERQNAVNSYARALQPSPTNDRMPRLPGER